MAYLISGDKCNGSGSYFGVRQPTTKTFVSPFVSVFMHYSLCIAKLWSNIIYFDSEQGIKFVQFFLGAGSFLLYLGHHILMMKFLAIALCCEFISPPGTFRNFLTNLHHNMASIAQPLIVC